MKKASIFFLLLLLLTIGVIILDWLKATYFLHKFHSLFVIFKTVYWPVTGILLMKYSLSRKMFRFFLITYLLLWGGYFLIKIFYSAAGHFHWFAFTVNEVNRSLIDYIGFAKLLTPIPFIFFWLIDNIFDIEQKKQS